MRAIRLRYVSGSRLLADTLAGRLRHEPGLALSPGGADTESADVLVVDEDPSGSDGVRAACATGARVVVLASGDDPSGAVAAARAGADAWLPRRCTADEFVHVVRHVAEGHAFYPREVQAAILRALRSDAGEAVGAAEEAPRGALAALTAREREVLDGLTEGCEAREIATRLGLSYHTVRTHLNEIFRKLDVHSRVDAVRVALGGEHASDEGPTVTPFIRSQ